MSIYFSGSEFLVNSNTTDSQHAPEADTLSNGNYVIVWVDYGVGTTSSTDIKGQVFNAEGAAVGAEFVVNDITLADQIQPAITALENGTFVVSWTDISRTVESDAGIRAQIFHNSGTPIGNSFRVNTVGGRGVQSKSDIAELNNGNFIITWDDPAGVYYQLFNADGTEVGDDTLGSPLNRASRDPSVSALVDGGFVVAWQDYSRAYLDQSGSAIVAQKFDVNGVKVSNEFLVNSTYNSTQNQPEVQALNNGNYIIIWGDSSKGGTNPDIRGQFFQSDGIQIGSEFIVNDTLSNVQVHPTIDVLSDGNLAIAWLDRSGQGADTSGDAIRTKILAPDGTTVSSEIVANTTTLNDQGWPAINALADGDFLITWADLSQTGSDTSSWAVRGQHFTQNSPDTSSEFSYAYSEGYKRFTGTGEGDKIEFLDDSSGNFSLGNFSFHQNGSDLNIFTGNGQAIAITQFFSTTLERVEKLKTADGLVLDLSYSGLVIDQFGSASGGDDLILMGISSETRTNGLDGNDTIIAGEGNDLVRGGAGHDQIYGGFHNDRIIGGTGNDLLTGGTGNDTFVFEPQFGTDVVTDFGSEVGNWDKLDLTGIAGLSLHDIQNNTAFVGNSAQISILNQGIVILEGIDSADFQAILNQGQILV